jgi:hypothetical protein
MSLSLKQVHELCEEALQERKKQRNVQVDDLVSKSVPFDVVEAGLRKLIMAHPENKTFSVPVLDTVTDGWGAFNQDKIREEVQEALLLKYREVFEGCVIIDAYRGNTAWFYFLIMSL